MKLKLYRSATVGINLGGLKILTDPWLTDGEHLGSWSHYPYYDLKSNLDEINSYNIIYISHIHPDHSSADTLKMIRKDIPVYIHDFHKKFLKGKIESLGFKVIELENGKKHQLNNNVNLNIFAADNCNPELCYRFSGCADLTAKNGSQQVDTLSIIEDNKNVLVNVNDCPFELAKSTFKTIKKEYKKIDVLLTGYCGAGPYPQCFDNLNLKEKKIAAKNKEKQFLNMAIEFIKEFRPSYFLPFAGTYTLTGSLHKLQNLRGNPTIDEAYDFFENYLKNNESLKNTKPIKMNPGQTFDLSIKKYSKSYSRINLNDYYKYVQKKLINKKLKYENHDVPSFDEIYELSKGAFVKFLDKKLINNVNLKTDIYIDLKDKFIKLPKNKAELEVVYNDNFKKKTNYVIYKMDPRLFKLLLKGPRYASWNDAEGGSHIKFLRKPDIFERGLYQLMQYFHN